MFHVSLFKKKKKKAVAVKKSPEDITVRSVIHLVFYKHLLSTYCGGAQYKALGVQ